jgi:hypothetical protein
MESFSHEDPREVHKALQSENEFEVDGHGEKYWPMINDEESKFIEENGGEYRGFVHRESGRRGFEDLRVKRVAYYDQTERAVLELLVGADGMNGEGSELLGSSEVVGFKLMFLRRRYDGELGEPEIISVLAEDFPERKLSTENLRQIAYELQNLAIENAPHLGRAAWRKYIEEQLQERGWRDTRKETGDPRPQDFLSA